MWTLQLPMPHRLPKLPRTRPLTLLQVWHNLFKMPVVHTNVEISFC